MNMKHDRERNFKKGFTLVEVLLYIGIVTLILGAIVPFAWNVIGLGEKSVTQQETYAAARYLSERLKHEIRNADAIDTSDFGDDLADDASKSFSAAQHGSSDTDRIFVEDGRVLIQQGSSDPVALQPQDMRVTSLVFTDYSSVDGTTKHAGFVFTIEANYPNASGRQEYQESVTIESSAEVRSL